MRHIDAVDWDHSYEGEPNPEENRERNGGANYLRAWRLHAGLSLEELAEKAGSTHQVMGYLERGRTQLSGKWLRKLAPILGTTPGRLLDYHPDDFRNNFALGWAETATEQQLRQIDEIARTITRTGTDD